MEHSERHCELKKPINSQSLAIYGLDVSDWYGPWMNRQQILSRFAARHRVVYSQGAWFSWDRFTAPWRASPLNTAFSESCGVEVHRRSKTLLRFPRFPVIDEKVVRAVAARLRRRVAGLSQMPQVAYVFHPSMYPYAKALQPDIVVYQAYDLFSAYPGVTPQEVEQEGALVAAADVVIAMSDLIAESLQEYTKKPVHVVSNGVDFQRFELSSVAGEPEELAIIPRPRVAYFGNLTEKVDLQLIRKLAEAKPGVSFILVGGNRLNTQKSKDLLDRCRELPNVYCLGHKDYEAVPAYMHGMDVNILAYRVGEGLWSEACSPLKLYEYLAVGRPVVSSPVDVVLPHSEVIAVARSNAEWTSAIDDAIDAGGVGTPASRQNVARRNTWDERIKTIEELIYSRLTALRS